MKFPPLSVTLFLLKPFQKREEKTNSHVSSNHNGAMTTYDKIEEIMMISDVHSENLEIGLKFYNLSEVQKQLTIVSLIEHDKFETLKMLLASSYNVNFLIRGQTPLHFAVDQQNKKMVSLLIKYKSDLELKNNFKETALNAAVRTANIEIINYLLEQGANVNTHSSDSSTPLENAIHQGDIQSVTILEQYGAKLGNSYLANSI